MAAIQNNLGQWVDSISGLPVANPNAGGLGNYASISDGQGGLMGIDKGAYDSMDAAGNTGMANIVGAGGDSTFGISNDIWGAAGNVANIGLGILNYKDAHAMNKATLAGKAQDLEAARTEAAATEAYRAAYGAGTKPKRV